MYRGVALADALTGTRGRSVAAVGTTASCGVARGERHSMKVAYVFSTSGHTASYKLGKMIMPQLEDDRHGVDVVGMFFNDSTG